MNQAAKLTAGHYMQVSIAASFCAVYPRPVASATTIVYRDRLVLASNVQWPDIQHPWMSKSNHSGELPLRMDRQTDNYNDITQSRLLRHTSMIFTLYSKLFTVILNSVKLLTVKAQR